ncbi:MAG: hypothetical protein K8R34_05980, partial [Methanosarcinales archaeon]|nr:hypothetical protein [Methanosarcinales archaeon]
MAQKWLRDVSDIARNIPKNQVGGILKKDLIIQPNEKAVIVKDGEVTDVLDSGKIRVGGLLKPGNFFKDVDVVIMDTSPKDLNWNMGELWTADKQKLGCSGLIRFRIGDIKRFFSMVYAYSTPDKKGERALGVQDIYSRLQSEVLTRVLEPEISRMPMEDIYGNRDLQITIENELETQLEETLDMWGLELLKHTAEWDLGEYKTVLDAHQKFQTEEELAELDTFAEEKKYEDIGRLDVAKVRADQASVSVWEDFRRGQELKDVQAQIERERLEDENDFWAAQEAIKLLEEKKRAKARGMRAELEVEQDMKDKEHGRDMEYMKTVTEAGGADVAKTISEGRELSNLSAAQIEALAKVRESEASGREDKVEFMKGIEDREREDAYRRQELDAKLMDAAKPVSAGLSA